jgi:predicted MPP superfamily phosphohydrolase
MGDAGLDREHPDDVTVRLFSDLHLEFRGNNVGRMLKHMEMAYGGVYPPVQGDHPSKDVCVLAGDIGHPFNQHGRPNQALETLLKTLSSRFAAVVMVAGNHCYYQAQDMRLSLTQIEDALRQMCERTGVVFLQKNTVVLQGVKFMGCTLWSDVTYTDYKRLNDSLRVFDSHRDYVGAHRDHLEWLRAELKATPDSQPVVVITHHPPSFKLSHQRFGTDALTGFGTDLERLIHEHRVKIRMWLCGHTHETMEVTIHDVPCLTNPLGYPGEEQHRASPVRREHVLRVQRVLRAPHVPDVPEALHPEPSNHSGPPPMSSPSVSSPSGSAAASSSSTSTLAAAAALEPNVAEDDDDDAKALASSCS